MFKIIHFTDLHLSPLNHIPQSRTKDYHEDVRQEIEIMKQTFKDEAADATCFSGDLFHLKNQAAYSPRDLNYYQRLFADFPPMFCIPGNHDLPKSAVVNLPDSPYKTLTDLLPGVFRNLSYPFYVNIPLPFKKFTNMCVIGLPYLNVPAMKEFFKNFNPAGYGNATGDNLYVFLVHVDATPQPMAIKLWESFTYQELTDLFPDNSILLMGHIHLSFPPFQNVAKNVITSKPWSVGRVIKDYFNQTDILEHLHIPSYSVITLDEDETGFKFGMNYKPFPNFKPSSEIFDLVSLQLQLEKSQEIQKKLMDLKQDVSEISKSSSFFISDPMVYLQGINLQKEVFDIIVEFLNKTKDKE
ncbi:MAG: metallophosphoesterase [Candidatus Pacearchaeota archaeon]